MFKCSLLSVGQVLGSIGSVGGGLALGKEGPLVHTGACIASVLGQVNFGMNSTKKYCTTT